VTRVFSNGRRDGDDERRELSNPSRHIGMIPKALENKHLHFKTVRALPWALYRLCVLPPSNNVSQTSASPVPHPLSCCDPRCGLDQICVFFLFSNVFSQASASPVLHSPSCCHPRCGLDQIKHQNLESEFASDRAAGKPYALPSLYIPVLTTETKTADEPGTTAPARAPSRNSDMGIKVLAEGISPVVAE
jgi:hypothetical protein